MGDSHKIYIDLDDVLCETALEFLSLLESRHGRKLTFDQLTSFDLGVSFGLSHIELAEFMAAAHEPQVLKLLKPVDGAIDAIKLWYEKGYEIHIVTGRPPSTLKASQQWLVMHNIPHTSLTFVDKYSRYDLNETTPLPVPLGELQSFGFCFAVEDSPSFVNYLVKTLGIPVALFDRPWNRNYVPEGAIAQKVLRCRGWRDVMYIFSLSIEGNSMQ